MELLSIFLSRLMHYLFNLIYPFIHLSNGNQAHAMLGRQWNFESSTLIKGSHYGPSSLLSTNPRQGT